jgi:hypothetical protein
MTRTRWLTLIDMVSFLDFVIEIAPRAGALAPPAASVAQPASIRHHRSGQTDSFVVLAIVAVRPRGPSLSRPA